MPPPIVPTVQFAEPISLAADFDAPRGILRELSKQSRLEILQLLLNRPKTTANLPRRWDELQALEDLGLVRSKQTGSGQEDTWSIDRNALAMVRDCRF